MGSTLPPRPTRVFVDTSVLFAGSLSGSGFARDLILAGSRGTLDIVLSQFGILKTRRNLARKAPQAVPFFEAFLASELVRLIDPPAALVRQMATTIALKDAPVIAGAIQAGAPSLPTYERKHLLAQAAMIQDEYRIILETPEAVLKRIG